MMRTIPALDLMDIPRYRAPSSGFLSHIPSTLLSTPYELNSPLSWPEDLLT